MRTASAEPGPAGRLAAAPTEVEAEVDFHDNGDRDIRARTPYAAVQLASRDSFRKLVRCGSPRPLRLIGRPAAIFSPLACKALVLGEFALGEVASGAADYIPFAFLLTVLLF